LIVFSHLDLRNASTLALDVKRTQPFLNFGLILLLEPLALGFDLSLDILVCLSLHLRMNFTTDTITLMLLRDRIVVFALLKHQLLLELLFALLLLLQTLVLTLDLQIDLFLFRQAPDF